MTRASWLASLRVSAALSFRLVRREPSSFVVAVAGAIVISGLFLGLGLITSQTNDRAAGRSYRVAVADDQQGADLFLAALDDDERLVVARVADPADAVIDSRAAIGLTLPTDFDQRIAEGADLDLRVLVRERQDVSLAAFGEIWRAVDAINEERLLAEGASPSLVTIETREVSEDERANQVRLAQALAAMVCFLCVRLVGTTSSVLGRAGEARANEVLLLLPLDRRALAAGIAAGTTPLHVVHLMLALGIVLGASMLPIPTLDLAPSTVAAMVPLALAGTVLLGLLAAATGVVAGALGAGGEDTVSVGDLLALPFVAVAVLLLLVSADVSSPLPAFAVPVLGQALVVRDGVVGSLTAVELAVATLSTVLVVGVCASAAARAMGHTRHLTHPPRRTARVPVRGEAPGWSPGPVPWCGGRSVSGALRAHMAASNPASAGSATSTATSTSTSLKLSSAV